MNDGPDVLVRFAEQATDLLHPLVRAARDPVELAALLAEMGWTFDGLSGLDPAPVIQAVDSAVTAIGDLAGDLTFDSLAGVLESLERLREVTENIADLAPAITEALGSGLPVTLVQALAQDLVQHLTLRWLVRRAPVVYHGAALLTLVDEEEATTLRLGGSIGPAVRLPVRRPALRLDRLPDLVRDPLAHLRAAYVPSGLTSQEQARAAIEVLFSRIQPVVGALGGTTTVGVLAGTQDDAASPPNPHVPRTAIVTLPFPGTPGGADDGPAPRVQVGSSIELVPTGGAGRSGRPGPGVELAPFGLITIEAALGAWTLQATVSGQPDRIFVDPAGATVVGQTAEVRIGLRLSKLPDSSGIAARIGSTDATRLELGQVAVELTAVFGPQVDYGLLLDVAAAFVLDARDGDGFLRRVLPEQSRVPFDLGLGWSQSRGLYVRGADGPGSGLEGTLPVALNLGPINIPGVHVAIRPDGDSVLLVLGASADVQLGPVSASVERMGLSARLSFPSGGGNLGPLEVDLHFAPPAGVALAIRSEAVTGSGYLFADPAGGAYAGAVQVQIGKVGVAAIGLLTTRMPDGSPGFSLVVLVSSRFPAIQLGMGFALTGLGGLIAVHRTVEIDELRRGLESGSLDAVLFPPDLVNNARQVAADLGRYFPPVANQYVLGPTAEIVWGSPPLVTITVGLFLELPNPLRIVLAGKLAMALPSRESPIVVINLDLLGGLDLESGQLALDAVLRDSKVAAFTLTGRAALRASWGDRPSFLLAAGGFNPRFQPPAEFPVLSRLALSLGAGNNPRLRLAAYFALTSNTVQVGARLDLFAALDVPVLGTFSVAAVVGFDALFQLSPFAFAIDISVHVLLTWGSDPFLAVRLDIALSGPQPWHAVGRATFECFGTHAIGFDVTIGAPPPPAAIERVDIEDEVVAALAQPGNWAAELPAATTGLVTLRSGAGSGSGIAVHPLGALTVRQQIAPLGLELARVGPARIDGARRLVVGAASLGGRPVGHDPVLDHFAPAQFLDLTDAEKLAAPSFERMPSGVRLRAAPAAVGGAVAVNVAVETVVVDPGPPHARFADPVVTVANGSMSTERLVSQLGAAAATQEGAAVRAARFAGPPQISVVEPDYALADDNLAVPSGAAAHLPTYVSAAEMRSTTPAMDGVFRVVEASEVTSGVNA